MRGWLGIGGVLAGLAGAAALAACSQAPPANNAAPASNAAPAPDNAAPAAAATSDAADAKAFLDGLYDHYKSYSTTFQPYDRNAKDVFDPDMIALLAADRKALKGDLGTLDGDLICDCQDYVSLKTTITVEAATPTTASATASFIDTGMKGDEGPRHAAFQLVKVNGAWRIHDIKAGDQDWLRKQLTDEIKDLKSAKSEHAPDDAPSP
jgi:hypothetical protein